MSAETCEDCQKLEHRIENLCKTIEIYRGIVKQFNIMEELWETNNEVSEM